MPKQPFQDPAEKKFIFPPAILKILSEVTNGNFLLFYDNQGEPEIQCEFSSTLSEMGLRAFVTNFISSINQAEGIASTQNILNEDHPPEDFNSPETDE